MNKGLIKQRDKYLKQAIKFRKKGLKLAEANALNNAVHLNEILTLNKIK